MGGEQSAHQGSGIAQTVKEVASSQGSQKRRDIAVVVVSFNTRDLTLSCIESVCDDPAVGSVCVVDNGSCDGSREALIRRSFIQHESGGPNLLVECLGENRGFGGANNIGALATESEFIALVNSDAVVLRGALESLRDYLLKHPHVGVVGPRLLNSDGSFQESRYHFPSPWKAWMENMGIHSLKRAFQFKNLLKSGRVEWLSGACILIRRSVWVEMGGFDEAFFLYSEETDLQRRIRRSGREIHWVPEALVTHLGGGSGAGRRSEVRECFFSGVDRYFLKHHGRAGAFSLRCATIFGAALRWTWALIRARDDKRAEAGWILKRQCSAPFPKGMKEP